jgi:hypothetical protein
MAHLVKIIVGRPVLESFFQIHEGRAVSIIEGVPADARMISFHFDMLHKKETGADQWFALFEHGCFEDVEDGGKIPEARVIYQAWKLEKPEQKPDEVVQEKTE